MNIAQLHPSWLPRNRYRLTWAEYRTTVVQSEVRCSTTRRRLGMVGRSCTPQANATLKSGFKHTNRRHQRASWLTISLYPTSLHGSEAYIMRLCPAVVQILVEWLHAAHTLAVSSTVNLPSLPLPPERAPPLDTLPPLLSLPLLTLPRPRPLGGAMSNNRVLCAKYLQISRTTLSRQTYYPHFTT